MQENIQKKNKNKIKFKKNNKVIIIITIEFLKRNF